MRNREDLMEFVKWVEEKFEKFPRLRDMITYPYTHCGIRASKIIEDCKDYDRCDRGSRDYLLCLAEGFKPILESWVRYEEAPKIKVRCKKTGKVMEVPDYEVNWFKDVIDIL